MALARTAQVLPLKKRMGGNSTICPYDASGCGFLVAAEDGKVVNIEGDPDHPINREVPLWTTRSVTSWQS